MILDHESRDSHAEALEFGRAYTGLLDWAIRGGERPRFDHAPERVHAMLTRYLDAIEKEARLLADHDPKASLTKLIESRGQDVRSFRGNVKLTGTAVGVAIAEMPAGLLKRLAADGRAAAYLPKKEAPLILLARYGRPELDEHERRENLPHEMQHVLWRWGSKAIAKNTESNALVAHGFQMYQDELLARAVSGGALFGYTHLRGVSQEELAATLGHDPDAKQMVETVAALNERWRDVETNLNGRNVNQIKHELLFDIMQAGNFQDLLNLAERTRSRYPALPNPSSDDAMAGWAAL